MTLLPFSLLFKCPLELNTAHAGKSGNVLAALFGVDQFSSVLYFR
jgi:hypothetical protein